MTLLLGLGIIGSRSADQLIAAGIDLKTWNRTPKDRPDSVDDLPAATAAAEVILCYLMDEKAVRDVFSQIAPSLGEDKTFINHATIDVATTLWLEEECKKLGCHFLDCPFTGSRDAAASGNLVYYLSGDSAVIEKHRALLEITSKEIVPLGPIPAATVVKITTNHVTASTVQAMTEAVEISRRHGVDPRAWHEAAKLNGCYAGAIGMKLPTLIEGDFTPHFSTKNMAKDVNYSCELADESGASPILGIRLRRRLQGLRQEHQEQDFSSLIHWQQASSTADESFPKTVLKRGILKATGPDTLRFLNGQVSNDVSLASEKTIPACILNMKGQMDGYLFIQEYNSEYFIDCPWSEKENIFQRLNRYLIADDVELTDVSEDWTLSHHDSQLDLGGHIQTFCKPSTRFGLPRWDILTRKNEIEIESWPHAHEHLEAHRILNGIPKWPNELFPGLLPAEANLDDLAISYTKGCYTGQEVVSRMKRAGKVNRKLVKLSLSKPLIPTKSTLLIDGQKAGFLTSVATIYPDQEIALGYLKRKFEDATTFKISSPSDGKIIGEATLR